MVLKTRCRVKEEETKSYKSCKFPFVWKDVKYNSCTTVDGTEGRPWCSTKVIPRTFEHDNSSLYFGDCNQNNPTCFNSEPTTSNTTTITQNPLLFSDRVRYKFLLLKASPF